MKVSKKVWIDNKVKWNPLKKQTLCRDNKYKGRAYIVCSSPQPHLLFEIVNARFLNVYYKDSILIALCRNKKQAVDYVMKLIDLKYNDQVG